LVSGVRRPEDLHGLGEDLGPAAHSGFREGGENLRGEIPAAAGKERVQSVFPPTAIQEKEPHQLFDLDRKGVDFRYGFRSEAVERDTAHEPSQAVGGNLQDRDGFQLGHIQSHRHRPIR
jgi:hypothetical protein